LRALDGTVFIQARRNKVGWNAALLYPLFQPVNMPRTSYLNLRRPDLASNFPQIPQKLVVAPIAPNTKKAGFEEFALSIDGTFDCPVRPQFTFDRASALRAEGQSSKTVLLRRANVLESIKPARP